MADLASVIVGGLLTLGAGGATQLALHVLKTDAEHKTKRATKFEELVTALYEYDHWLDTMRNVRVFGDEAKPSMSPYAKVHSIASLYFPNFMESIAKLNLEADKYELWMMREGQKRFRKELDDLGNGGVEASEAYRKCRIRLISELQSYGSLQFKQGPIASKVANYFR